jgi:hypothetical protein
MQPRYEDAEVAVYPTEPVVGRDCAIEHDLGEGMVLVETSLSTQDIAPDVMLELEVVWGTTSAPGENLRLELSLVDEEGNVGQVEQFQVSPAWPTQAWPANAIVRDRYALQVEPWPRAGQQTLVARLFRVADGQPIGPEAELGRVTMHVPERVFVAPPMERTVEARFGDALRLLGYDLRVDASAIDIVLHWRALRRMDKNYKFFVHLYDVPSGELAAQKDVIPYDWQYPTVWWEADEVVSDRVGVPLEGVLAGTYQLAVGIYDARTEDRLSIHGDGLSVISEALILQEVTLP